MGITKNFNSLLTIFTIFLYLTSTVQTQGSCSVNGIDLSPLTIPKGGKYYTATYLNRDVFTWNICAPVVSGCLNNQTVVCQYSGGSYWSFGLYSTQTIREPGIITIKYLNGDTCTGVSGQPKRATTIQLICSNDVVPVVSVVSESSCVCTLRMATMYACETLPSSTSTPRPASSPTRTTSATASASASQSPSSSATSATTPSPTASASPSPTKNTAGNSACNAVKVKAIPSTFSNNLAYGSAFNSNCSQGSSVASQFYYYIPALTGVLNVTTCGLTSMDTIINVYVSYDCQNLGKCIASNDDGCADPVLSQSLIAMDVVEDVPYYFEVRTYGSSAAGPYSIAFYN